MSFRLFFKLNDDDDDDDDDYDFSRDLIRQKKQKKMGTVK